MALKTSPSSAAEMELIIAVFVKVLVERPRHAAIVNGFKRYTALTMVLSRRSLFLEDVKSLVDTASPESAMASRALAFRRSTKV